MTVCLSPLSVPNIARAEEETSSETEIQPTAALLPFDTLVKPPPEKEPVTSVRPSVVHSAKQQAVPPVFTIAADWAAAVNGYSMTNVDTSATLFLPPPAGPFPLTLTPAFSFTSIEAPATSEIPDSLYDLSLGLGWMQPLNEHWMVNYIFSAAIATDFENQTSDMWQFRGGVIGLYNYSEEWKFAVGAMATGRKDVPVIPAVGLTWTPTPDWKVDLMFPQPRVMYLLSESSYEKNWLYLGTGFDGGAWAFERSDGTDDFTTYREWKCVLGVESNPVKQPGELMASGMKLMFEAGWIFGRTFEYDSGAPDEELDSTFKLRGLIKY